MAHRWRSATAVVLAVAAGAVLNYELVAKAPLLLGGEAPGGWAARRAERSVRYRRLTGFPPLDHLLHEGDEAARYYAVLLDRDQNRRRRWTSSSRARYAR